MIFVKKGESEKCTKYYKMKIADIPECKDSNQVAVAGIDNIMRIAYLGIKYNYEKDENNKYCPLNSLLINKNITDKASK